MNNSDKSPHALPELPHLGTFCRVAETNNFTATARDLGLTQAAVSGRIRSLEETLGVSLFDRRSDGAFLTAAGERLYPIAAQIAALHQVARQAVAGEAPELTGELVISASSVPGEHLLPRLLAEFHKRHPIVRVRAQVADSQVALDAVEQGQAAVGLVGMRGEHPHLEFTPFARDRLVLLAPREHDLTGRDTLPASELGRYPLVLRESGSGSRSCFEEAWAAAGLSRGQLHVALELGSNEAIKEAVASGLGVAVLSERAVEREVRAGIFHSLIIAGLNLDRDIFFVRDRRRVLSPVAQAFVDTLGGSALSSATAPG